MENAVALRPEDGLIQSAIEHGLDTDKLEKLIELRNKEYARNAKADYDLHFAEMQRDFVPVGRSKEAKDYDGKKLYAYCPLEDILLANQPIISKHGFSYRWAEESLANGEKRIWCIVAGYGHEERSFIDIPIISGSKATNSIQQRGSATSYGKRYSFLNAFGIIIADEDNDAQNVSDRRPSRPEPAPEAQGDEPRNVTPPPPEPAADEAHHLAQLRTDMTALNTEFAEIMKTMIGEKPAFDDEEKTEARAQRAECMETGPDKGARLRLTDRDYARLNSIVEEYRVKLAEKQAAAAMAEEPPASPLPATEPTQPSPAAPAVAQQSPVKIGTDPEHAKKVVEQMFAGIVPKSEAPTMAAEEELF